VSKLKETEGIGIIAFAFGVPDTILSNRRIAEIASRKAKELKAPVYTQLDVHIQPDEIEIEYTDEKPGNPPPTLRIARGAVRWAKRLGLRELWISAAKPQLWRCLRDIEQAVREAGIQIKVRAFKEIEQYSEDEWFCPDSTQERTRSREVWDKRERILKLMPFFLYKRVAS
jgi:hypothetical protein